MRLSALCVALALAGWGGTARAYTCWGYTSSKISGCMAFTTETYASHATSNWFDYSYVYLPTTPLVSDGTNPTPRLLLLFAGTGADLAGYTNFMAEAATRGYYVIGLAYLNDHSHTSMCGCMNYCPGWLYDQNVNGNDNGFYSWDAQNGRPPANNSVSYRLKKLINYIETQVWPYGYFSQFYDSNNDHPKWSQIVVAGHSGGGNMATWILKNKSVPIAITFSALNMVANSPQPSSSMSSYTPYYVGGGKGTCDPATSPYFYDWMTNTINLAGKVGHLFSYDSQLDSAFTGTWIGHDILDANYSVGKSSFDVQWFMDGQTPSSTWIVRQNLNSGCGSCNNNGNGDDCNPYKTSQNGYHNETIMNCGLDHHGVWDYLLDVASHYPY
jgi:hypothetical protein